MTLLVMRDRQFPLEWSWLLSMEQPLRGVETNVETKDEVLRKIGRNVLLFQQAEYDLKWLAARVHVGGVPQELLECFDNTKKQVSGETMGAVAQRLINAPALSERSLAKGGRSTSDEERRHIGFGFEMVSGAEGVDAGLQDGLEGLVKDRNELVHQFLGRFDLETVDGLQEAGKYLDDQYARHLPTVEILNDRKDEVARGFKVLFESLDQEDVQKELLFGSLRLTVEDVLRRVAADKAWADGWTDLSSAGAELAREDPELLKMLRNAFGHQGLRQVVSSMSGWELCEEGMDGGGTRVRYRPKEHQPPKE